MYIYFAHSNEEEDEQQTSSLENSISKDKDDSGKVTTANQLTDQLLSLSNKPGTVVILII